MQEQEPKKRIGGQLFVYGDEDDGWLCFLAAALEPCQAALGTVRVGSRTQDSTMMLDDSSWGEV